MSLFLEKIPRGKLYHSLISSVLYLVWAIFKPLNKRNIVSRFESEFAAYTMHKHCVSFPFARTAVYAVLKSKKLPCGGEILLPSITIKGMVDVVMELGFVPVYVDSDPETFCFDLDDLKDKVSEKTVAALVTPLFGLVPDMEALFDTLKGQDIFVMVDFSQCLNGSFKDRPVSSYADVGIYSSSSIKTLDTLGGGLVVTEDEELYQLIGEEQKKLLSPSRWHLIKKAWVNLVRNVATQPIVFSCLTFYMIRLLGFINKESALKMTGGRSKKRLKKLPLIWFSQYSSIQASIGLRELQSVKAVDIKRINLAESIKSVHPHSVFPSTTSYSTNVYWQLVLAVDNAIAAQEQLAQMGIDSATSSLELVSRLEFNPVQCSTPRADHLYENALIIPCFPSLNEANLLRLKQGLSEVLDHA